MMQNRYAAITTALIVLILVGACGTPAPAATPVPPTATVAARATQVPSATPPATPATPLAVLAPQTAVPTTQPAAPATPAADPSTPGAVPDIAADLVGLDVDTFFEASYKKLLLRDPEMITQIGLNDAWGLPNDQLTDISDDYIRETQQLEAAILDLLRGYDRAALTPEQQVTYDVYEWYLDDRARGYPFMYDDYPASFLITTGVNEQLVQFFTDVHPITDEQDAQDYITRLSQVEAKLEQLVEGLQRREQEGVVMPRFLLPWVLYGVNNVARSQARATPFYTAFEAKVGALSDLSAEEKEALLQAAEREIEASVLPGFQALAAELEHQQQIATDDAGAWKLPDGADYYAYALRHHTTTDLTADEIHQIGLEELDRIHAEMRAVFDELGYPQAGGLPALIGRVVRDSGTLRGDDVAAGYEALITAAARDVGVAFDLRPTADVVVQAGPAGDYYNPPAVDGSRPGVFYARVTGSKEKFAMPTLAYHETIPGHHFQIAIAQELPLPLLRKDLGFMAYTEGWALYAEQLAYELGFYQDDAYGNIGRLQAEAFRAARLVVDTGLHARKWSYDQAVDFMIENTGLPRDMVETEVGRYIVWPGQATAYKIGMLKILELRQRAMDALGDQFDLKAFHNVVLGSGSLPLGVLERVVDDWIEAQQGQAATPEPDAAAGSDAWLKTYGGAHNTVIGGLLPTDDGGFYVVGTTDVQFEGEGAGDVYLLRIDAEGETLWTKTYGGEGYDGGQSISWAADGNLLIAGVTNSSGAGGMDAYLLKVDGDGNELWSRTYGGPLDEMVGGVGATEGGYLLGGNIVDPDDVVADPGAAGYGGFAGRANIYLLKVDADGREIWSRAYDSQDNVLAAAGLQTPDGGFLVLATITYFPDPDNDLVLTKLDPDGAEAWSRTWAEDSIVGYDLVETPDGNYVISASYAPLEGGTDVKEDYLFIQVDPQGQEMWRSTFGEPDMIDYGVALAPTADGGYVAVGERTRDRYTWEADIALVKIDARGRPLWQQIRPAAHTMFSRVLQVPAGGYLIAGATFGDPVFNILLARTDVHGNLGQPSAASQPARVAAEASARLDALASGEGFSGAVLVAHDGTPLFRGAYGLAQRDPDLPNQIDTKFNLGSMDKMFTAVAILQLVEQGVLSLDDTIAAVLPDYPNREVAESVTIHHLLTHTSGLGDWSESEQFPELHDQIRSVEDYLPLFVDDPLAFEPGAQFRYSNAGYIVLGLIVEAATGQSYYDYVRENIFEPSGMIHTGAYELDAEVPNRAVGYTRRAIDGSKLDELTDYLFAMPYRGGPSGGGFSTAGDLLRFASALQDHRLLSPASTELLLEGKVRLDEQAQYAYGFFDWTRAGQRVVGHSGGAPGICDFMDIYLDEGYTVVVLSNSDGDCRGAMEALRQALSP